MHTEFSYNQTPQLKNTLKSKRRASSYEHGPTNLVVLVIRIELTLKTLKASSCRCSQIRLEQSYIGISSYSIKIYSKIIVLSGRYLIIETCRARIKSNDHCTLWLYIKALFSALIILTSAVLFKLFDSWKFLLIC